MKTSQKGNRNQKELKTKEQYKKAFEETHDLLKQEEKKREKCQKELEDLQAKSATGNELSEISASAVKELEDTSTQLKEANDKINRLQKDFEEMKRLNKCAQQEKEELVQKLNDTEKKIAEFASFQSTSDAEKDVEVEIQEPETEIPSEKEIPENGVFKEIKLLQERQPVEANIPLRAGRPFSLTTHLRFPVVPDEKNVDIDTHSYDVLVVATDERKNKVVARSGAADILTVGIRDYENTINMPALEAGKYRLRIYTLAPFARLKESKQLELSVQ